MSLVKRESRAVRPFDWWPTEDRFEQIELQTRIHLAIVSDDRQSMFELFAEGFGQTGEAPSFRQGFAAAASMVLFFLVLIIGFLANRFVTWRERKFL